MDNSSSPRGFRNNNPLNIRKGSTWKGLSPVQSDKSFCQFISMHYGIRAALYLLLKYYKKYRLRTLYSIIHRWAPENENNTWNYCLLVAKELDIPSKFISSFDLNLACDPGMLYLLLCAMVFVENGRHLYISKDEFYQIINHEIPAKF